MGDAYYMLLASLPHLPHFLKADRLPINLQRLRWRRAALQPEDTRDLESAIALMQWRRHELGRTDRDIDALYKRFMRDAQNEALREFVEYRMGLRSLMAGLRRKHRGLPAPTGDEVCGVGRWNLVIKTHWDRDDFGMAAVYPCLPQARAALAVGKAVELQRLLMGAVWNTLSRIQELHDFGFEAVFAYVFKWDILARWLSYEQEGAARAFTTMVQEIIHEHELKFA